MLVVGRKIGQRIRIETSDGVIYVTVAKGGAKVSLAIEAPRTIKVVRDELRTEAK
jgi:carbon storage regulator CsrA